MSPVIARQRRRWLTADSRTSPPARSAKEPPLSPPPRKRTPTWAVIAILALSGTVVSLQQTMVIPLLPDFPQILDITADDASWLVTATLLTSAVATPIVSKLADMFGKRLMMVVSMVVMTLGSVLAAVGGDFLPVIIGRALQGFATALIPVGISIMRDELPKEKVGSAVALMSATLGIGGALGLPLSGIIFEQLGWQAIFWISAATGVALIAGVLALVSESEVRTRGRFDYGGALLLSIALSALLLAISKGGTWGWGSEPVILLFILTAAALGIWFPFELKVSQPLVDLRTSARRPVLLTNIASILVGFAMFANMLLTTQQLQLPAATGYGFELPVIMAGLAMVPSGLAMVVFSPVSGRMINRFGGKTTLITGAAIMAVSYIGRVFWSDTVLAVIVGSTLVGVGTAIAYAAMPTLIMANVPITETASANGLNTLLRAIGTSTSSAAVAAVLASVTMEVGGADLPSFQAFQDVFWMAGLAALASCAIAWYLPAFRRPAVIPAEVAVEPAVLAEFTTPAVTAAGESHEVVVHGSILQPDRTPAHPAVVTVVKTDGTPVDWSRADNEGSYSVVLPGPGQYLVVANAGGWVPRAEVFEFRDETTRQHIMLTDRLTLSGTVRRGGSPVSGALVTLTEGGGEFVRSVRADGHGRYTMPLPPNGRYIVTMLEPDTMRAHARKVTLDVRSAVVDLEAPPDPAPPPVDSAAGA
jgi:MFS family permease